MNVVGQRQVPQNNGATTYGAVRTNYGTSRHPCTPGHRSMAQVGWVAPLGLWFPWATGSYRWVAPLGLGGNFYGFAV